MHLPAKPPGRPHVLQALRLRQSGYVQHLLHQTRMLRGGHVPENAERPGQFVRHVQRRLAVCRVDGSRLAD